MPDKLGSEQKQLEANLALLQLDGVDVDVLRNMIVGTPSREGELGVAEDSQTGDFNGMSFISNGTEIAVTGGKADVSGISGEISLQGYQYGRAIPDSVTSRPDDDDSYSEGGSTGLVITPASDFSEIGFTISNNTSGATRARLYDYDLDSYEIAQDISGLSSGDAVTFEYDFIAGQDYGLELDADGGSWTAGYRPEETSYPYTGDDIDIVNQSINGSQDTFAVRAVNDIGSTGL